MSRASKRKFKNNNSLRLTKRQSNLLKRGKNINVYVQVSNTPILTRPKYIPEGIEY